MFVIGNPQYFYFGTTLGTRVGWNSSVLSWHPKFQGGRDSSSERFPS